MPPTQSVNGQNGAPTLSTQFKEDFPPAPSILHRPTSTHIGLPPLSQIANHRSSISSFTDTSSPSSIPQFTDPAQYSPPNVPTQTSIGSFNATVHPTVAPHSQASYFATSFAPPQMHPAYVSSTDMSANTINRPFPPIYAPSAPPSTMSTQAYSKHQSSMPAYNQNVMYGYGNFPVQHTTYNHRTVSTSSPAINHVMSPHQHSIASLQHPSHQTGPNSSGSPAHRLSQDLIHRHSPSLPDALLPPGNSLSTRAYSQSYPLQAPHARPVSHTQSHSQSIPQNSSATAPTNSAPGPIPATTPLVVRQDQNGVQWIAFEYSRDRVKTEYVIRCDVESVDTKTLSAEFKQENCVYPRAACKKEDYKGNRLHYETECNTVGWALAQLNPALRGKRGLVQRAVDSWRNSNSDPRLRSRRVRRQAKLNTRNRANSQHNGNSSQQINLPGAVGAIVTMGHGSQSLTAPSFAGPNLNVPLVPSNLNATRHPDEPESLSTTSAFGGQHI